MEVRRLLGHPIEQITRDTMKQLGVELTGQGIPCIACSKVKTRRNAVPKPTDTRSNSRAGRFLVNLGRSMPAINLGGSQYVMIYMDDFTRFKIERLLKKSGAPTALRNTIAEYITPDSSKTGFIRTNEGGELGGEFQQLLHSMVLPMR